MTTARRRPNVIVFLTDQQRWDTLGVSGNPAGLTPNLDRMSAYGTHFDHACTTNPVCAPARAALQTGLYPTTSGVYRNDRFLDPSTPTLAGWFAAAGYHTGYIGKWHLADRNPVPREQRGGYREWLASNTLEFTSDAYRTVVWDTEDREVSLPGYRVDALTDAAVRFVDAHQHKPFLLFLSFIEPHHQNEYDDHPAPDGYEQRYAGSWLPPDLAALGGSAHRHLGGYYGQVKRLDEALGRVRDALRSLELDDDTILAYTSDHGSHFKTRNDEYKRSCHDASVRVPLVLTGGPFDAGGRHRAQVSTVDVVPTLLDAAGLDVPDGLQGSSLVPLVTRQPYGVDRSSVLIQVSESDVGRALRTERWKYYVRADDPTDVPSVDVYTEAALYDLAADPYEQVDLIGMASYEDVIADLRQRLSDQIERVEGVRPAIRPVPRERNLRFPMTHVRRDHPRETQYDGSDGSI